MYFFLIYIFTYLFISVLPFIYQSKKDDEDQESIQSSAIPDPGYKCESDNFTIKHHKREATLSQQVTTMHL